MHAYTCPSTHLNRVMRPLERLSDTACIGPQVVNNEFAYQQYVQLLFLFIIFFYISVNGTILQKHPSGHFA